MRTPEDLPPRAPRRPQPRRAGNGRGRGRVWLVVALIVFVVLIASLKSLATLYTDSLWFRSVGQHRVWSTVLSVKIGLFVVFGALFFAVLYVNLFLTDRMAANAPPLALDDELVIRFQHLTQRFAGRIRAALCFVLALFAGSAAIGEWNNWILLTHAQNFGVRTPEFGKDVGFFVFDLPFLQFLVDWWLVVLVVILLVTVGFHYLNGGIRPQGPAPRVRPVVKAHLSVLLALMAVVKAFGYVLQKYELSTSTNGYVEGPGYTDVHARIPALELLFVISLLAAAILLYNIRRRDWALPIMAVGVWAFVALVIGVIYPALLQEFKVTPAQSNLELKYIARNITATRAAYGLNHVQTATFQGTATVTPSVVSANKQTLENIRLWDPFGTISVTTFRKLQDERSYYTFPTVGVDRYTVDGKLTPALVGVRQISTDIPQPSWVNTHLEYTHGEGVALALANTATSQGDPEFGVENVPPSSSKGLPKVVQPRVYFGLNQSGYVVANSKQPELDYQTKVSQADITSHYSGPGGVRMGSLFTRAVFALDLGDYNLFFSDLVTDQSRIMYVRNVVTMARKVAPFLSYDADPYAAIVTGQIDWIIDAYVTTTRYPYSQTASTQQVPPGSGLPANYNYVRNAVKVVVNAYTGQMTFYTMDDDPILRAYKSAFPGLFSPSSAMPKSLREHLRYPEDIFSIQAAVYGRYHITSPSNFYTAGAAWTLSPTSGVGKPGSSLAVTQTTNAQGQVVSASLTRMSPLYEVLAEPGEKHQSFTIIDAYIPAAQGESIQNLSAFMMANSNPTRYGQLRVYRTKPGSTVIGPALADAEIQANVQVSHTISLLNTNGSSVLLGNTVIVPIGESMLYVKPLYVQSSSNPQPQLKDVIAVFGKNVAMAGTIDAALSDVLKVKVGTAVTPSTPTTPTVQTPPTTTTSTPSAVAKAEKDLKQAATDFAQAKLDLKNGTLSAYAKEVTAAEQQEAAAQQALASATPTSTSTPSKSASTSKPSSSKSSGSGTGSKKGHAGGSSTGSGDATTTTTAPPNEA